jgi:hypothetical protein
MLPVTIIEPLINIDPVISNVSALDANTKLPVSLLKFIDPDILNDPDIVTDWFSVETYEAVLANADVCAKDADNTYDAVVAYDAD